jgi:signal transduction histidine kinase
MSAVPRSPATSCEALSAEPGAPILLIEQAVGDIARIAALVCETSFAALAVRRAGLAWCRETGRTDKAVAIRVEGDAQRVRISVADNGVGIRHENMARLFTHGFTTRASGHGFGLHSGALAARELGGSLSATSAGPGCGATFVLELPCAPRQT